jgi:hypothetical protein
MVRAMVAEKSVDQTREAYEHSKNALEEAVNVRRRIGSIQMLH